jgi:hypothetical protein
VEVVVDELEGVSFTVTWSFGTAVMVRRIVVVMGACVALSVCVEPMMRDQELVRFVLDMPLAQLWVIPDGG